MSSDSVCVWPHLDGGWPDGFLIGYYYYYYYHHHHHRPPADLLASSPPHLLTSSPANGHGTSSFRVHEVGQKTLLRLGRNRLEIGHMVSTQRTDIHPPPITAAWLMQSADAKIHMTYTGEIRQDRFVLCARQQMVGG